MLAKNNLSEKLRRIERQSKQERFSIRKLTVGAAAVLIGASFIGLNNQTAKADTIDSGTKTYLDSSDTKKQTTTGVSENKESNFSDTTTKVASNTTKVDANPTLSTYDGLNHFLRSTKSNDADNKSKNSVSTTNDNNTINKADTLADDITIANVNNQDGFIAAMNNGQYKTVNLTGDVNIAANATDTLFNKLGEIGVRGNKVINGNGHTLNLTDNQLSGNIVESQDIPSITFNNITVNGTGSYLTHLPILNGIPWTTLGDFNNINLNNVTTNGITFGGGLDSTLINCNVNVSGKTVINYQGNDKNSKNSTLFDGNLNVAKGASLEVRAANLIQLFNGEAMTDIHNIIPNFDTIKNGHLEDAIKGISLGSKFTVAEKANVNIYLDSTVSRLCDATILNINVADGARFKMIDNAPAIRSQFLDPLSNLVFLTANSPASVKIITTNADVKRPQVRYIGTDISGKALGMSDAGKGKNWIFNATHTNLLTLIDIPIVSDVIETLLPGFNISGMNETLVNDYQTPVNEISAKGKANRTFAALGTLQNLKDYCTYINGPLFDAKDIPIIGSIVGDPIDKLLGISTVPGLQLGTDLEDVLIKTGAGRFNVKANLQTIDKNENAVSQGEDILSVVDSNDNSTRTMDQLKTTKVVTGAQWLVGKKMLSNGQVVDGGVITSAKGKVDKTNLSNTIDSADLGNAVIQVTYSDGTFDQIPVQIKLAYDNNATNDSNGSKDSNSSKDSNGSNGANGSKGSSSSNGANNTANANGSNGLTGTNGSATTDNNSNKEANDQQAIEKIIRHNAYVYDIDGARTSKMYKMGARVNTYGRKFINGRRYYKIDKNKYVVASNIDGTSRKLKHNAALYSKSAKRLAHRRTLKKGTYVRTYGGAVKLHAKKFYIVKGGKFIKKANFRR